MEKRVGKKMDPAIGNEITSMHEMSERVVDSHH